MKYQIKEFAKLTDVSVRTLHYYDETGLLKPAFVDEQNGYRFYDENSLARMQEILFYRELDFPLKDILKILSSPDYDRKKALEAQKELMILKKNRIEKLISALDDAVKGVKINMKVFDNSEFEEKREEYAREAKEKWGNTEAYSEFEKKTRSFSTDDIRSLAAGIDEVMDEFAECMKNGSAPDSAEAKGLVRKLQNYITETSYTCTDEILAGLGQMYTADERFRKNIDRHGEGTAQFISDAIDKYCSSVK
ncbi:MAG: MerR family transcriptional regulator [Oscillospiraceae bacterium]|nr:MerR family transcriptional regulator [Oscillospiraceae bacterium]MBR3536874.1 MerR family transcriptional regulator [Oscillospiraceae bacterium]